MTPHDRAGCTYAMLRLRSADDDLAHHHVRRGDARRYGVPQSKARSDDADQHIDDAHRSKGGSDGGQADAAACNADGRPRSLRRLVAPSRTITNQQPRLASVQRQWHRHDHGESSRAGERNVRSNSRAHERVADLANRRVRGRDARGATRVRRKQQEAGHDGARSESRRRQGCCR